MYLNILLFIYMSLYVCIYIYIDIFIICVIQAYRIILDPDQTQPA